MTARGCILRICWEIDHGIMSPGSAVKESELSGSLGPFQQPLTIVSQGSSDSKGISVSRIKGM